jgi:hypothetical protein
MTNVAVPDAPDSHKEDFLIHEAAHVVAAWELGRPVRLVTFDHATWSGLSYIEFATSALPESDSSDHARALAESDVIVLHAGMAAQRVFNYEAAICCTPRADLDSVALILTAFERDSSLLLAWSTYLAQRALILVQQPETWTRIEEVARILASRSRLSHRQLTLIRGRLFPRPEPQENTTP